MQCKNTQEETNNLQVKYFTQVKSFVRKEIIGKEEKYLVGREHSELENLLQGKYFTV